MRIAIIGKSGQLAQALMNAPLPDKTPLSDSTWVRSAFGRPHFDISNADQVRSALGDFAPDIIINAAAYTAVDKAESEPDEAFAVNRDGPENLARLAHDLDIPLVHISTDYVFDGTATQPYREEAQTAPLGVYGTTKLAGEHAIADACPKHIILRTAWVHSPWGGNFVKTMLRLAKERDALSVVNDQTGSPTYAPDMAEAILAILPKLKAARVDDDVWGVYHLTNAGITTWFGFAQEIFGRAQAAGLKIPNLEPIGTEQFPTPAKRPAFSVLDNAKFERVFGVRMRDWQAAAADCVNALTKTGAS